MSNISPHPDRGATAGKKRSGHGAVDGGGTLQKMVIIFDKIGKFFLFCRKFKDDFLKKVPHFDLSFLSVYGNL